MPVPPDPILRAALRWLEQVPISSVRRTRALFATHSEFSDITPTQYAAAYAWLLEVGLIDSVGHDQTAGSSNQVVVFQAAVKDTLWFADADVLVTGSEEVPEDARRAAMAVGLRVEDAYAAIRHAWGKVDAVARERVGSAGEQALVQLLSTLSNVHVRHVAAESDGYGYDIAVETPRLVAHLEVKATTRRERLAIFLSRNEHDVMLRDPAWMLVAVRLDSDLQLAASGTVDRDWIATVAPVDHYSESRWESVKLEVPPERLAAGIPDLRDALSDCCPAILVGDPPWPGVMANEPQR